MAGYHGWSMSNNAVAAYNNGEKTLSKWTKNAILQAVAKIDPEKAELLAGVKLSVLKSNILSANSWHHTSKFYNETDFYSVEQDVVELLTAEDIKKLVSLSRSLKTKPATTEKFLGDIEYLEWSGSRRSPHSVSKKLENVMIEKKGCYYTVFNDSGEKILRKRIDSNGTRVISCEEKKERLELTKRKREFRQKNEERARQVSSPAAWDFYKENEGRFEYSQSNHLYLKERKPSSWDYECGLERWFKIGEKRLAQKINSLGKVINGFDLEIWNGHAWEKEQLSEPIDVPLPSDLFLAIDEENVEAVAQLLKDCADCDAVDLYGQSPLAKAVDSGNCEIVTLLLDAGADVNARDNHGLTPLMKASLNGNATIVKLLLSADADANLQDECGRTALRLTNNTDIQNLLLAFSKGEK